MCSGPGETGSTAAQDVTICVATTATMLRAGRGDDVMDDDAAAHADRFLGGRGWDRVSWQEDVQSSPTWRGLAHGHGRDVLRGIESLVGTLGRDTLIGTAGRNTLKGMAGDDRIRRSRRPILSMAARDRLPRRRRGHGHACRLEESVRNANLPRSTGKAQPGTTPTRASRST